MILLFPFVAYSTKARPSPCRQRSAISCDRQGGAASRRAARDTAELEAPPPCAVPLRDRCRPIYTLYTTCKQVLIYIPVRSADGGLHSKRVGKSTPISRLVAYPLLRPCPPKDKSLHMVTIDRVMNSFNIVLYDFFIKARRISCMGHAGLPAHCPLCPWRC